MNFYTIVTRTVILLSYEIFNENIILVLGKTNEGFFYNVIKN